MANDNQIIINPDGFDADISNYQSKVGEVNTLKHKVSEQKLILTSIDNYKKCIENFNQCIKDFSELSSKDVEQMKRIKAAWLKLDLETSQMTLGDIITKK